VDGTSVTTPGAEVARGSLAPGTLQGSHFVCLENSQCFVLAFEDLTNGGELPAAANALTWRLWEGSRATGGSPELSGGENTHAQGHPLNTPWAPLNI